VTELLIVLVATAAGVLATGAARSLALRTGFVNHPNPINPDHTNAVAYLGGLGIVGGATVGLIVAIVVGLDVGALAPGLVGGSLAMLAAGLYDDLRALGAGAKMVLQAGAVGVALLLGGVAPTLTGVAAFDALFSALWLLAVVNAFNFIDVLDGLAGSIAVVSLALFAIVAGVEPVASAALIGGTLGFLAWNRAPARVYMGDAGSHFLGFVLAAYALSAPSGPFPWPILASMVLFTALAWFDLFFQTITRMAQGRRWWVAGPDSFALHLRASGLSKNAVVVVACVVAATLWLIGDALPAWPLPAQAAAVAGVAAFAALAWVVLLRSPVVSPSAVKLSKGDR
jgi:UDP-GlcNAc:undecaprenyl-phosphate GlcNAc-1-phosphate transferase